MTATRTILIASACAVSLTACDFLIARSPDEPEPVEITAPLPPRKKRRSRCLPKRNAR